MNEAAAQIGGAMSYDDVTFGLEVEGADTTWAVRSVQIEETLNRMPACTVRALCSRAPDVDDILDANAHVTIERPTQQRSFKGIVRHASVRELVEGEEVELHIVPALWLLGQIVDSRIYQNKTVIEIIDDVFSRLLGPRRRTVRSVTQTSYVPREYTTQYQETTLAFLSRLTEEEGIFWFFDHEAGDHEELVLADGTSGLPQARENDGGRAPYARDPRQVPDREAVSDVAYDKVIGATDVVLSDFDWTNPSLRVLAEQTGRGESEPALEIYDHTDAVSLQRYAGTQYGGNSASVQARLRAERADLMRQSWAMHATVISAQPGRLLEVQGCPDGAFDQRYLIVQASGQGAAHEGERGSWQSALRVVPSSMPYRPAQRTPKPKAGGPETAIVVGPSGEEIHTDEHGRVRVHLHWDRVNAPDAEDSSCWMRVRQNWAGPGFGAFFLPRIGMEVLVEFLGGNPDRPVVTGCLYNGDNAPPASPLPAKKTQTVIRTKSSVHSDGYNELRFEDDAGNEFIFIHAQKDLNEVVEHNHSTRVKANQTNTVDGDQTETVHGNQSMTVDKDREKTIKQSETTRITQNRTEFVEGSEDVIIETNRFHSIKGNEALLVREGTRTVEVRTGKDTETYRGGRDVSVLAGEQLHVQGGAHRDVDVSGHDHLTVTGSFRVLQANSEELLLDGQIKITSSSKVEIHAPGCSIQMGSGRINAHADDQIGLSAGGASFTLHSDGTISAVGSNKVEAQGGSGGLLLDGQGAAISGPKVASSASGANEISGGLVKING